MLTVQIKVQPSWENLRDVLVLLGPALTDVHVVAMLCRLASLARSQRDFWPTATNSPSPGAPSPPAATDPRPGPGPASTSAPGPHADPLATPTPQQLAARQAVLSLLIRELAERTKDALPSIDPGGVAGVAAALATLRHYDHTLVADIQRRSVPCMATLPPGHLINLLWAFACFRHYHQHPVDAQWLDTATFSVGTRLNSLRATHVARVLYALALLGHRPGADWLHSFLGALVAAAPAFNTQDLTTSLYALGVLRVPLPAVVLPALDAEVQRHLARMQPRHFGNVAWAWGRLRHRPPSALRGAFVHRALQRLAGFNDQHIANLLWGFIAARIPLSKGLQDRCWKAICIQLRLQQLAPPCPRHRLRRRRPADAPAKPPTAPPGAPRLAPRAFCSILWSIAVGGYRPTNKWLGMYFYASRGQLRDFPPRALATTVWAVGELGYLPNDEWMFDLGQELQVALPRCRPVDLVQLLCGFRRLKQEFQYQLDDALLDRLLNSAVARLPDFGAAQTAALLAAACSLYQKPSMRAMLAALAHFDRQLHVADAHAVSNVVWALGRLGGRSVDRPVVMATGELVGRLLAASHASLPRCNSVDLVQQAIGWAALQYNPGVAWLQEHERQCCRELVRAAQVAPRGRRAGGATAAATGPAVAAAVHDVRPEPVAGLVGHAGGAAGGQQQAADGPREAGQQPAGAARAAGSPGQRQPAVAPQVGLVGQQPVAARLHPSTNQQQQQQQQQLQQLWEVDSATHAGRCTPGFTKSEAQKLAAAYQALGYRLQHPLLQRLMHAAARQPEPLLQPQPPMQPPPQPPPPQQQQQQWHQPHLVAGAPQGTLQPGQPGQLWWGSAPLGGPGASMHAAQSQGGRRPGVGARHGSA